MLIMESQEINDIAISAIVLAIAFGIALSGGVSGFYDLSNLANNFIIALVTIALAFILHELGHRTIARRYGCFAVYKMWPHGLVLAILFSFFGFVFAAPGAVMIHPRIDLYGNVQRITKRMMGLIAVAGPLVNIILAGIFFSLTIGFPYLAWMFNPAVLINVWLALFNLLPIPPLDGSKIFRWDKRIWAVLFVIVMLFIFGY